MQLLALLVAATTTTLVPGAHQDGADLWGILLALILIGGAVVAVRAGFRSKR